MLMPSLMAQNQDKEIVLDKQTPSKMVMFNNFLEVKATIVENTDDGAIVSVTVSNKDNGINQSPYKVFFFMTPKNKEQLKKQKIKMTGEFFKSFNDKNSDRKTDHVQILGNEYSNDEAFKQPLHDDTPLFNGDSMNLKLFTLPFNQRESLRLPVYTCKKLELKNGTLKNVEIIKEDIFDVAIEVKGKAKPKENLVLRELNNQLDELKQEIEDASFCSNTKKHPNQKKPYLNRLDQLKDQAQAELDSQGFEAGSEECKPFDDFFAAIQAERESLNKIKGTKCDQCKSTPTPAKPTPGKHNCSYCNWSESQIESTLHSIAQSFQKNGNGDKKKAQNIHSCPNALKRFNAKANRYYNDIISSTPKPKQDSPKYTKEQIRTQMHQLAVEYRQANSFGKKKLKSQAANLYNIAKQNGWANDPSISKDYKVFK